jgi:hypothetical protein
MVKDELSVEALFALKNYSSGIIAVTPVFI